MEYSLTSPIPAKTTLDPVIGMTAALPQVKMIWKDGSDVVHILATVGGDATDDIKWSGVYLNPATGVHSFVDGTYGQCRNAVYHPTSDTVYGVTHYYYICSVWKFKVSTGLVTVPLTITSQGLDLIVGDDDKVYVIDINHHVYSIDPADGDAVVDYDEVTTSNQEQYASLACDGTNIYAYVENTARDKLLYYAAVGETPDWQAWAYNGLGDKGLEIRKYRLLAGDTAPWHWLVKRTLADDSVKYYLLEGGITEVDHTLYSLLEWDDTLTYPHTPNLLTYPLYAFWGWAQVYGWDLDVDTIIPIYTVRETIRLGYRAGGSGDYTYIEENYLGLWENLPLAEAFPKSGKYIDGNASGNACAVEVNYHGNEIEYKGYEIVSPYQSLVLSSGDVAVSGYPGMTYIYDPSSPWTLTYSNLTPVAPGDAGWESRPNPYFIKVGSSPTIQYLTALAEDSSGILWVGGNDTRTTPNYGNLWWYNLATGDKDTVLDAWANLYRLGAICSAVNGTKIVASCRDTGFLYVIDAENKTIDGYAELGSAVAADALVETSNDVVVGVTNGDKIFKFKPSTRDILVSPQALGVAGTAFGGFTSSTSRNNRKLVLGPDNNIWMYIGNKIYTINPDDLSTTEIYADTTYRKLVFANSKLDLIGFNNVSDIVTWEGIFSVSYNSNAPLGIEGGQPGGMPGGKVDGI